MLFLAVFCGFLAEYKLELTIEHEKEEQYIKSLVKDIKTDTAMLTANIKRFERMIAHQDTILSNLSMFRRGFNAQLHGRYNRNLKGYPDFIYTDGTLQQLKNAGGFRLIRNHDAVDSITKYDRAIRQAMINEQVLATSLKELEMMRNRIFNFQALDSLVNAGIPDSTIEKLGIPYFLADDREFSLFYNQIKYFKWVCIIITGNIKAVKKKGANLI